MAKTRDLASLSFPGKEEGEKVQEFLCKHWIVEIPIIVKMLVMMAIYVGVLALLFVNLFEMPNNLLWVIFSGASIALAAYFLMQLVDWMDQLMDVFVLTDKRLVSFEQEGLFRRVSKEMDLAQVEDVQAEQDTWLENLLHTGHLMIANKSENILFRIDNIYQPHLAKRKIMDAREECMSRRVMDQREREIEEIVKRTHLTMEQAGDMHEEVMVRAEKTPQVVDQIEVPDTRY